MVLVEDDASSAFVVVLAALVVDAASVLVASGEVAVLSEPELVVLGAGVDAKSVSEVDGSEVAGELSDLAASSSLVALVLGSVGSLDCARLAEVERVSRLSAGEVAFGSKPSSSLSGAAEVGAGALLEALSGALFCDPFDSAGCCCCCCLPDGAADPFPPADCLTAAGFLAPPFGSCCCLADGAAAPLAAPFVACFSCGASVVVVVVVVVLVVVVELAGFLPLAGAADSSCCCC